jgi:alpha-ketoglutarate-dependent taurine dioxygenase
MYCRPPTTHRERMAQELTVTYLNDILLEGEQGIYDISLDRQVNQKADYLKGSLFWHFDGSLQPCPNRAAILRAVELSESGEQTEFCNTYSRACVTGPRSPATSTVMDGRGATC